MDARLVNGTIPGNVANKPDEMQVLRPLLVDFLSVQESREN